MLYISMGDNEENTSDGHDDRDDFRKLRGAARDQGAAEHDKDRRKVLQNRPDSGGRELDGREVEELADGDARQAIGNQQEDAFLAADDAEELVAVCEKAVEEKHDARQRQANRHQPARIHPLHLKEVLSHRAGCAPASAAAHGHERT